MMDTHKMKSPGSGEKPGDGCVGERETKLRLNCVGSIPASQPRRLPAYGRELVEAARQGYTVPWLCIALDWGIGRTLPRVVIPADTQADEVDLHLVSGLGCMVAHRDETIRALDVAEAALIAGATECPVFDVAAGKLTATTAEVMMIRGLRVAA